MVETFWMTARGYSQHGFVRSLADSRPLLAELARQPRPQAGVHAALSPPIPHRALFCSHSTVPGGHGVTAILR